jgi:hypothetical protein
VWLGDEVNGYVAEEAVLAASEDSAAVEILFCQASEA